MTAKTAESDGPAQGVRFPVPAVPADLATDLADAHGVEFVASVNARLAGIAADWDDPAVTVGFAGHFSSGKSSVLNALLGRSVLPTSDFPETGVPCWIRGNDCDRAAAVVNGAEYEIPLVKESIAELIALVSDVGDYRNEPEQVTEMRLTVAAAPFPERMSLVDLPGVNDSSTMTDRVWAVTARMDILVWVVDSRRPMSETDQEHLDRLAGDHGIGSISFVVNAFLPEDTSAGWRAFSKRAAAFHFRRISDARPDRIPEVVFLSARAALTDPTGFGAPETHQLVESFADHRQPRIRAARWRKSAAATRGLSEDLAPTVRRCQENLSEQQVRFDRANRELLEREERFRAALLAAIGWTIHRHSPAIVQCGHFLAAHVISAGMLRRDGFYGSHLTHQVQSVVEALAGELVAMVARIAAELGFTAPTAHTVDQLRMLLYPVQLEISVPRHAPDGGLRNVITERVGGIAGTKPSSMAVGKDRAAARENAVSAATGFANDLVGRQSSVADLFVTACHPTAAAPTPPDPTALRVLENLRAYLVQRADEYDSLAHHASPKAST